MHVCCVSNDQCTVANVRPFTCSLACQPLPSALRLLCNRWAVTRRVGVARETISPVPIVCMYVCTYVAILYVAIWCVLFGFECFLQQSLLHLSNIVKLGLSVELLFTMYVYIYFDLYSLCIYVCMTILHSLFLFNPIVSSASFSCLFSFFFSLLLLVSVLFWVPCEVASWLKAFPGKISVQYQDLKLQQCLCMEQSLSSLTILPPTLWYACVWAKVNMLPQSPLGMWLLWTSLLTPLKGHKYNEYSYPIDMNLITLAKAKKYFTSRSLYMWPSLHSLKPLWDLRLRSQSALTSSKWPHSYVCCWFQVLGPSKCNYSCLCVCWSHTGSQEDKSEFG